jgi:hypothetical protein
MTSRTTVASERSAGNCPLEGGEVVIRNVISGEKFGCHCQFDDQLEEFCSFGNECFVACEFRLNSCSGIRENAGVPAAVHGTAGCQVAASGSRRLPGHCPSAWRASAQPEPAV